MNVSKMHTVKILCGGRQLLGEASSKIVLIRESDITPPKKSTNNYY